MRFASLCGVFLFLCACGGPTTQPTVVKGSDWDAAVISGRWEGTYEGIDSGRKGVIHFELTAGDRVAEGVVIMNADIPDKRAKLRIKFIAAGKDGVTGTLAPYTDPSCNCVVVTEFAGTLTGKVLAGTFTTKPKDAPDKVQRGKWSVERKAP